MNKPNLSSNQMIAINHFTGPALVVAGPGSGKTTVITNRINFLIYQKHIKPENILVITFSKMAAVSMQSRFNQTNSYLPVNFGTFHSIFFNILKQSNIDKYNRVASRKDKHTIIYNILKNKSFIDNTEPEFIDSIIKRISFYKNTGLERDNTDICPIREELFNDIYNEYQDGLHSINLIDFDDMMLDCKNLLINNPKIVDMYREKFKFILIDEFQDINDLQFEIIKLLVCDENIFVVGDDDQSIYGFRGSNPSIMRNFKNHFPEAKIIYLSCNYRSNKNIVDFSSALISHNDNRIDKKIYTNNEEGKLVSLSTYKSKEDELQGICSMIKQEPNLAGGNIAILFRNNHSVSRMVEALLKNDIKSETIEKINNPFDNSIVRDFIHYLHLAYNINRMESIDFIPIMNKPVRYISRSMISERYVDLEKLIKQCKDRDYITEKIIKLRSDLLFLRSMDLYSAFHYFRHIIGYEQYRLDNCTNDRDKVKETFTYVQEHLREFKLLDDFIQFINQFDEINDKCQKVQVKEKGIYVMTYHASKGLEFDNVLIPHLIEGEVPSSKSVTNDNIEEERRMLYVAFTRAKKRLILSYVKDENNKHMMSRFLYDIINDVEFIKC